MRVNLSLKISVKLIIQSKEPTKYKVKIDVQLWPFKKIRVKMKVHSRLSKVQNQNGSLALDPQSPELKKWKSNPETPKVQI